jgi:DNA/RNA endonuclease YhcR with UshA esterase domain
MKRITNYLIAMALMAFTFTSCEDVPNPFGQILPPGGDDDVETFTPEGSGTLTDPFNVQGVLEYVTGLGADVQSDKDIYVKGYVTTIKEQYSAQYGNAQFTMSDSKEGGNTFTFYRGLYLGNKKWADGDATLSEGDEVIICGKVVNYKGTTPETVQNAAYLYSLNGKTEGGGGGDTPTPTPTEAKAVSVSDFLAAAESTSDWYQLTGTIKNLKDGDLYGNFDIEDATGSVYVYGLLSEKGGEKKKFQELVTAKGIANGKKITIIGNRGAYNGSPQVTNAYFVSIEDGGGDTPAPTGNDGSLEKPFTPAEANAFIATLAADTNTDKDYYIKGKLVKYANNGEFGTQYGNASFYLSADGTESGEQFYVFRTLYLGNVKYSDDSWTKPKTGDEIIICGKLVNYKGNTPETVANKSYIYSLNGKTE